MMAQFHVSWFVAFVPNDFPHNPRAVTVALTVDTLTLGEKLTVHNPVNNRRKTKRRACFLLFIILN